MAKNHTAVSQFSWQVEVQKWQSVSTQGDASQFPGYSPGQPLAPYHLAEIDPRPDKQQTHDWYLGRQEQLNKDLKTSFLISKQVYDQVKDENFFFSKYSGIRLKGIENPIDVYQVSNSSNIVDQEG